MNPRYVFIATVHSDIELKTELFYNHQAAWDFVIHNFEGVEQWMVELLQGAFGQPQDCACCPWKLYPACTNDHNAEGVLATQALLDAFIGVNGRLRPTVEYSAERETFFSECLDCVDTGCAYQTFDIKSVEM